MHRIIIEISADRNMKAQIYSKDEISSDANYIENDIASYFYPAIMRTIAAVIRRIKANGIKCAATINAAESSCNKANGEKKA
ncbi:hypothetical protein M0R72_21525 [Candidatus Pacearchaeota archaeon]|jgi:hypothetical protein|nr:hypothetical protein [Candidatus Pacearchaeota archaeon]